MIESYPGKKGSVKWEVEEVIKQKKQEGGDIYFVSAAFDYDISNNNAYRNFFDDEFNINNNRKNNIITYILCYDENSYDENSYAGSSSSNIYTVNEKHLEAIDTYADMYTTKLKSENQYQYTSNTEIDEAYFNIDAVKVTVFFICAPQTEEVEVFSLLVGFSISSEILGKKDTFSSVIPYKMAESGTTGYNAEKAFFKLFGDDKLPVFRIMPDKDWGRPYRRRN
jgi:hypothetical protein